MLLIAAAPGFSKMPRPAKKLPFACTVPCPFGAVETTGTPLTVTTPDPVTSMPYCVLLLNVLEAWPAVTTTLTAPLPPT